MGTGHAKQIAIDTIFLWNSTKKKVSLNKTYSMVGEKLLKQNVQLFTYNTVHFYHAASLLYVQILSVYQVKICYSIACQCYHLAITIRHI